MRRWLVSCCPLIVDANGNLFGTTASGGANFIDGGTVFEIAKTANGYAGTPTTLVSFCASFPLGCADGAGPSSGLIADAKGNRFGTTASGGAHGSVSGNLISLGGTVFEVEKTDDGYASTPATLVSFCALANCADGSGPGGGLIFDADGNLFGTTTGAFAVHQGRFTVSTVFELAKITGGYTGTPTVLASFCAADNCASPTPGLTADSHGDLFGATDIGGANGGGTVFEIVKTARGYANTPTTLVNFCSLAPNCADGQHPAGGLIADAKGNLFGTTEFGGANGGGAVFEIVKTANGYASAPTTLVS